MDAHWISAGVAVVALGLSVFSLRRSSRKEDVEATDKRIDERIELKVGTQIAVMNERLTTIQAAVINNANIVKNTVDATTNAITGAAEAMLRIRES